MEIDEATVWGYVTISNLKREDNGTYVCEASNAYNMSMASQDVIVLERPEISLDSVVAQDPRTAAITWHVEYQGNQPIRRFHLQVKNYSTGVDWLDIDDKIPPNITSYTVRYLAPAMTYGFQLAAVNDAGSSEWTTTDITMLPDVPPKVSWVHVLASTNETLLFGWRRPSHDNGANITHYTVRLIHADDLVANKTLTVLPAVRNNHMYVFVSLEPGETYSFQVQACSNIGCGNWSEPLEADTSDGMADPPEDVEMRCFSGAEENLNYVVVTWMQPKNARGTIQAYNVTLEGQAKYRNMNGQVILDRFKESHEIKSDSLEFKSTIKSNTNYTVRVCTLNRAGCGPFSSSSSKSSCATPPTVPFSIPKYILQRFNSKENSRQLKLQLQRVSERNGFIRCYRVIIIKLKEGETMTTLPFDSKALNISSYYEVHKQRGFGAYIAEAFNSERFINEVVIGDDRFSLCEQVELEMQASDLTTRLRRATLQHTPTTELSPMEAVYDGQLSASTNYTGFVEVHVWGPNGTILAKQSPYFSPIQTGSLPPHLPTESPVAVILGVVCGLILVVLVLVIVLCLIKRKNGHMYEEDGERMGLTALIRRTIQGNGHLPRGKGGHPSKAPQFGPVASYDLPSAFVERHSDSDLLFQSEFEALPEKFKDRTTNASDSPENLSKNRYPDIKAYDQTRVRLPMIEGVPGSDYVNANFVEGYKARKIFICAQGPLDRTVTDFWRMIWEHRVTVVVMLTGIEEHGKVKCAQYWVDDGTKEIEKFFAVTVSSSKKYSDYIVRRFHVTHTKDDITEEREVLHFHFLMWKDFLAPEQPCWLLRFIKRVTEHYSPDRGPLLVHCSAGVGRTGTFVATDTLLQQLEEEGQVDIFTCISNLRRQRNFLVQSLKQYIFVYCALMEHAQFGDTEIEIRHLRDHYAQLKQKIGDTEKTGLQMEFEKLSEVIEDPKTCCVGTMDMNMNKNRYEFIIPYDINRVILPPSPSRDHSSYINASFIQGYDRSLSFIITQDPLECTVTEFWRMVKEQSISTIVMLSEIGEGQTKCQQYWPSKGRKECDYIHVTFKNEDSAPNFIKRDFSVTNSKNNDSHAVTQFQFLAWVGALGVVPETTTDLICLIEQVQINQLNNSNSGPITVHCSGGGDRSSVYVTLSVLIQQLKAEERVDVFQAARYTRSQRHCMLQTLAQYDFLYKGLLDYIESHNLCDMGDTPL